MHRTLSSITKEIEILEWRGPDPEITGIFYDSRRLVPGGLFAATDGLHTDGHNYIDQALEKGASAVLHSRPLAQYREGIAYIRTKNPRLDLSPLAAAYYDHPSRKMKIIGVTGTDGKTSTVFLIHQLLQMAGLKSGFLSTAAYCAGGEVLKNPYRQSTPEAPEVQEILAKMAEAGCSCAVVESTSHGLSPLTGRLTDVEFNTGVFTNITHEHLEFHGTFENYRRDKSRLFERTAASNPPGTSVLNLDDPSFAFMNQAAAGQAFTYSRSDTRADLYCAAFEADQEGNTVRLTGRALTEKGFETDGLPMRINIPGSFNVENTLAALLAVHATAGKPIEDFIPLVPELRGVKGRMRKIDRGQPFTVIVDYAHTPGAFEKLLPSVRETTPGRLVALFGSAGERDEAKRPMQGRIAGRYCDILILTDEDPRGEDSLKIIKDIAAGVEAREESRPEVHLVTDRRKAIGRAFELATEGDTVLLLGKGHESSIIYADGPKPWDEETEAGKQLAVMGYKG